MSAPESSPGATSPPSSRATRFVRACRGESVDTTPVWIMRQAGRYLPEYRRTRERAGSFLTLCKTPDLACEVTLQPIDRLGVDAAILFCDILIPLEAMGLPLSFTDGEGPRIEPVRDERGAHALVVPDPVERMGFVMDAIRLIRRSLDGKVPLIGFAGAPWTLLCYAVEGKTSKTWERTRRMLYQEPALARLLLEKITLTTIEYLRAQVEAGAQVVQLFDSWAGALPRAVYQEFALPYVRRIIDALRPTGVPFIFFCNEVAAHLPEAALAGADVLGVDGRLPLDEIRGRLAGDPAVAAAGRSGDSFVLQGNFDNCALFATPDVIDRIAADVIARAGERHIFNLGHGILPETPVEHAIALVESVHRHGARR